MVDGAENGAILRVADLSVEIAGIKVKGKLKEEYVMADDPGIRQLPCEKCGKLTNHSEYYSKELGRWVFRCSQCGKIR